jgi:hypothetical protein
VADSDNFTLGFIGPVTGSNRQKPSVKICVFLSFSDFFTLFYGFFIAGKKRPKFASKWYFWAKCRFAGCEILSSFFQVFEQFQQWFSRNFQV